VSGGLATQVGTLARRSLLKTLRQPFQLFPIVFFPMILLGINASGLKAATRIPGFPTNSYITFALAVVFVQGALFSLINAGTNVAEDVETGFMNRLALTPMSGVGLIGGLLLGVAAMGALQSVLYIAVGLIAGGHVAAGVPGVIVLIMLGTLAAVGFGSLGIWAGLRTGSGQAVQGMFPLFFVLLLLSSANLPRNLIQTEWFHTVATWNPLSYLLEGLRSLLIDGWDPTALGRSVAVGVALLALGLWAASSGLKLRMART
jgi:ABC-2 type transport system permease protein